MEKIKDFLRNAAIPIVGGIIGAFIGMGIATLLFSFTSVVLPDMDEFEFETPAQEQIWDEIEKDNKFRKKIESALKEALYIGDGAFKVAVDTTISDYPILEWYPGDRVEFIYQRDRIREIVFKTPYREKGRTYVLNERYGFGYIINELYLDNKLVDVKTIKATAISARTNLLTS